MCDPLSASARMAGGGPCARRVLAMASTYGCWESSKKGSLHGVIEKLQYFHLRSFHPGLNAILFMIQITSIYSI